MEISGCSPSSPAAPPASASPRRASLRAAGADVVIVDLPGSGGEAVEGVTFVAADVTDEAQVQAAVDAASAPLRIVVNCAGIGTPGKTLGRDGPLPLSTFERVLRVNLLGTFNVIRLAARAIAATEPVDGERGVIVSTASVAAFDGQIGQAAYSASKGGVVGMTLPIARELAAHLIRVDDHRPRHLRHPDAGRPAPRRRASRSAARCRIRPVWESPPSTPRWCGISSRTLCSTARRFASTVRSGWRPAKRNARRRPTMSYCINCGSQLQPGAKFCSACGTAVVTGEGQPAARAGAPDTATGPAGRRRAPGR